MTEGGREKKTDGQSAHGSADPERIVAQRTGSNKNIRQAQIFIAFDPETKSSAKRFFISLPCGTGFVVEIDLLLSPLKERNKGLQ